MKDKDKIKEIIKDIKEESEEILDGEYYVIHSDYINDLENAIADMNNKPHIEFGKDGLGIWFSDKEENKGIEKLDIYNCFQTMGVDKSGRLDINFQDITDKINEIIDFLNKEK